MKWSWRRSTSSSRTKTQALWLGRRDQTRTVTEQDLETQGPFVARSKNWKLKFCLES